ncbi:transducin/WD-40 repeat-containing protein [Dorcoceras hygrometricum]|uniref:Transducin/WD-40 repeat-containing protein n=1 Tax=Dorcoceras hygrometricum TaxID=472368 RepID=A0A2Z7B033_9LAMI|nr:transducin/WD-40 repeat-containing protein [Dorcoceras hygrometricum]KZV26967.1 transducin/WD-40 repeat-containing protein [Dorcoceras hygrometricum]
MAQSTSERKVCLLMVLMRCLNGKREQSSNTVALDENNRAKLVMDKSARTEEDQLVEEKTGSIDLVKLDAYERDGRRNAKAGVCDHDNVDAYDDRRSHVVRYQMNRGRSFLW